MNEKRKNSGLSRKDFFRYILVAAGVSAVGGGSYIILKRETLNEPLTVESVRDQFSDLEGSFQVIGRKYIEQYSPSLSESNLLREINDKLSTGHINRNFLSDLSDLVRQQILRDFEESNVVNLEGWIISETEAQICALLSM